MIDLPATEAGDPLVARAVFALARSRFR